MQTRDVQDIPAGSVMRGATKRPVGEPMALRAGIYVD